MSFLSINRWKVATLFLGLAFAGVAIGWATSSLSINDALEEYPLIDPARNFIAQENFIVNLQPLREELRDLVRWEHPRQVSLYFEFLNSGANISINQDVRVWPASLPKVPMALAVAKKIERGEWELTDKFSIQEDDRDSRYGRLAGVPAGTVFTVEELLKAMLKDSDNTAYRAFLRRIDSRELEAVIGELGLDELFTIDGLVSAKEYSRLFRSLYTSSFLKRENSELILSMLAAANYREFLAGGIPREVPFPHKFGIDRERHAYLDSGIVYVEGRPFLISVAVGGEGTEGEEEKVKEFMHLVAEKAYQYISSQ